MTGVDRSIPNSLQTHLRSRILWYSAFTSMNTFFLLWDCKKVSEKEKEYCFIHVREKAGNCCSESKIVPWFIVREDRPKSSHSGKEKKERNICWVPTVLEMHLQNKRLSVEICPRLHFWLYKWWKALVLIKGKPQSLILEESNETNWILVANCCCYCPLISIWKEERKTLSFKPSQK